MRHLWKRPAALLMGLALMGCVRPVGIDPTGRTVTLSLMPALSGARQTQTVVSPYTASSIQRLDVVPYVEAGTNVFQPLSATTGAPTTDSDPQLLKLSQSAPLDLNHAFTFTHLRPNQRYRVYARAYTAGGTLISDDAYSYSEVTLTTNDRPTIAPLPLKLIDRPFAATLGVTISNVGGSGYDWVVATLKKVVNGSATVVGSYSTGKANFPGTLPLSNLKANTSYRLEVSFEKSGTQVATAATAINIGTDNAPPALSLDIEAPYNFVVSTYVPSSVGVLRSPGPIAYCPIGSTFVANCSTGEIYRYIDPMALTYVTTLAQPGGMAVDGAENLYVSELANKTIKKVIPYGGTSTFATGFTQPYDLARDTSGNLYVADGSSNTVKMVTPQGGVSTLANVGATAYGVTVDPNGVVYCSAGTSVVRINQGLVTTLATGLSYPSGLTVDARGNVFVTVRHGIKRITPTGTVTWVAGADISGLTDGASSSARFNSPYGVQLGPGGVLFVTDYTNNAIRKITP